MRRVYTLLLIITMIAFPVYGRSQEEKTPDWTHMHGDAFHTAYSSVELPPPLKLLWRKPFDSAPHSNVVACWDSDTPLLFTGDGSGNFFCMKPDTGEVVWKYSVDGSAFLGSPVIFTSYDGTKKVMAVSSDGIKDSGTGSIIAHCFDLKGKIIWKTSLDGTFCESSPTFQNGFLYVATGTMSHGSSSGGYLYKIRQDTGDSVWKASLPDAPATASPSLIGGKVYIACSKLHVGSFDGRWLGAYIRGAVFVAVDDSNGTAVDKLDYGNMRMDILTVYDGEEIILSGQSVAVYRRKYVDPRDPRRFYYVEVEEPKSLVARVKPDNLSTEWRSYPTIYGDGHIYAHTPIVSNGWIIIGADEGVVYAYNKKDATQQWAYKMSNGIRLCMAASDNYIYLNEGDTPPNCGSCKAKFKIVEINSGRILWSYQLDEAGLGGVTVFDKYVYTFDRGNVYCFTRSGPPKLMVDPIKIDLGEIPKGRTEKTSFNVWNGGEGTLIGTVKFNVPYMKLSSDQFMLTTETKQFVCTIDTKNLTVGQVYNIPILVEATNGDKQTVIITFTVTGLPIIKVTPPTIDFGTVEKGTYSEAEIFIDNIGEGTLRGNIKTDMAWLSLEYQSWEGNHKKLIATADTLMLDYNRSYKANVFFESNGGTAKVEVTIKIKQKGPRLVVYPTELIFTDVNWGDQLTGTFAISNGGIQTLEGTLEPNSDWIILSSKDFSLTTDPKNFKVEIGTKQLKDGATTKGQILITSNGGTKVVDITITIKPRPPQLKVDPPTLFFNQCEPDQIYESKITISNLGSGVLSGTIKPGPGADWLKIKQGVFDISKAPIDIPIIVDTKGMAKNTSYTGKIIIESNGGTDEVGVVVVMSERKRFTVELWIGSYEARINGKPSKLDWPPYINKGATMVPARFISEAFGCIVDFYPKHKAIEEIYISRGEVQVTLYVGKNYCLVGNQKVQLDVPPEIKNKRTFVPIRFISEVFGADIVWDKDTQKVTIGYWQD